MQRRHFIQQTAFSAALFSTPGLFADMLQTPKMTEGPFYPDKLPLDTDNDLLLLNDAITPAVGAITHLSGRILDAQGNPVRNAFVEIWQVDHNGAYLHSGSGNKEKADSNFQGYGRFLTASQGDYYFRTVKPVPYPGRTPHIHFAVNKNGHRLLTTQLLIKGHEMNKGDGVFRSITDPKLRDAVMAEFKPIEGSKVGELSANFDIVLGSTPEELEDGTLRGGIPKSQYRRRS